MLTLSLFYWMNEMHPNGYDATIPRRPVEHMSTGHAAKKAKKTLTVLLLVPVLTQALFALVRGHFMSLTLLSARHGALWFFVLQI